MKGKSLLLTLSLLLFKIALSQNTYDIDFSGKDRAQMCKSCLKAFKKQPKEVKFSVKRENSDLYFEINDKEWFNSLFQNSGDGLAIDIVSKDRYACELQTINEKQIRGFLLKPVYSEALKRGLKNVEDNLFSTWIGKIPNQFLDKKLEFNIVFIGNKSSCLYNVLYDLDSYASDLLDMG